ncbi:MAG: penicillin-binding protein [Bacteroidetes bacterium]|nr:MAG: penicillin-binding protein [Bacteroidota bacterium]
MKIFGKELTTTRIQKARKVLRWLFGLFIVGLPLYFKAVEYNFLYLFGSMPSLESLENPKIPTASELYTSDGVLLGRYYKENRSPVTYDEIPPKMILALLATEDVRFYEHSGIDLIATVSVFWYIAKGDKRGGSTLTQQLAKNLFKTREADAKGLLGHVPLINTFISKTKEWITAINLESSFSKDEILTMYLNTVDFGSNAFGIKTASKTFFKKMPHELTVDESAILIGLLKAPTFYSPLKNPENAFRRRNTVLAQMVKYDFLTQSEYEQASQKPISVNYTVENAETGAGTYFRSVVNTYMEKWCAENGYDLYADGLKIYTTIDSRIQKHGEDALAEHLKYLQKEFYKHWQGADPWTDRRNNPLPNYIANTIKTLPVYKVLAKKYANKKDSIEIALNQKKKMRVFSWNGERDTLFSSIDSLKYYKHYLHASQMSMDPISGYIKSWVGGINYKYFQYDHVQQAKRQPGSTFKVFVYAAAIDEGGYSPCDRLVDKYTIIRYKEDGKDKVWSPHNADWNFTGESMTLRYAIGCSINTIAAQLTEKIGWETVAKYAKKMGITSELKAVPSIGLGSNNVSLYEMVGAYGTFVNKGIWTEPTFITRIEQKGRVIMSAKPQKRGAMSEESAFLMTHMLKGGLQEPGGTSGRLYRYNILGGNEIGGKTGTSSGHADGWYMGITKDLVSGVWVGGDDLSIHFRTSDIGEGSKLALPIFGLFLEKVYADSSLNITKGAFPAPEVKINKPYWCPTPRKLVKDSTDVEDTEL